ncbi:MAG: hypothetical protein IRY87_20000 [Acetobacteraceae bacterium]|nr:hypothetical protein [Acetobacteraceae bacterium]
MLRPMIAAAALTLCAALPAMAQDHGGVRLRGPASVLDRIESVGRTGCPLSQTNVTFGVNRAFGAGSQARQQLGTDASGGCRPLVSTQVTAGVNLALGPRSRAEQSVESFAPRGLLATNNVARGVNIAAGARSAAGQRILSQTGR